MWRKLRRTAEIALLFAYTDIPEIQCAVKQLYTDHDHSNIGEYELQLHKTPHDFSANNRLDTDTEGLKQKIAFNANSVRECNSMQFKWNKILL